MGGHSNIPAINFMFVLTKLINKIRSLSVGHEPMRSAGQFCIPESTAIVNYNYPSLGVKNSRLLATYSLSDVTIYSEWGFLSKTINEKRYLLMESVEDGLEKYQAITKANVLSAVKPRQLHFDQPVFVLNNAASRSNYWHFILDCLPRLFLLMMNGRRDFIILHSKKLPSFARQFAELISAKFDVAKEEIDLSTPVTLKTDVLMMDSFRVHSGNTAVLYPAEVFSCLPNMLVESLQIVPNLNSTPEIILIDRRGSRQIVNQDKLLKRFPFVTPVELENMPVARQIAIFHGAKVILGVHGAGLVNLIFSPIDSVVGYWPLFFDEPDITDPISLLIDSRGQNAVFLPATSPDSRKHQSGGTVEVDLSALERFFAELGYI